MLSTTPFCVEARRRSLSNNRLLVPRLRTSFHVCQPYVVKTGTYRAADHAIAESR